MPNVEPYAGRELMTLRLRPQLKLSHAQLTSHPVTQEKAISDLAF